MARTSFAVTVDTLSTDTLADRLTTLSAGRLLAGTVPAVNKTARQAREAGKGRILSGINLTDAYVEDRLTLTEATDASAPVAKISSPIKSTLLTTYKAKFQVKDVSWTNEFIRSTGKRIGPNYLKGDWVLRRGRPNLGVQVNKKAAGLQVEVLKGAPKPISYAFLVHTKRGQDITMKRTAAGNVVAAYGPSVYQLFRHALNQPDYLRTVADDLERNTFAEITKNITEAL